MANLAPTPTTLFIPENWRTLAILRKPLKEAAESSNKDVRYIRQHHTCKTSRAREMADHMHGLLVRTDPVISSLR
ncbi:Protein-L-isoaspartate O-methyltransferase 2 [Frankliniella fusca]|uniref:Protein-L-isoaspartate O-methyltransferase 2 n=1 Tax=Frankliniella fusca TaxID=407009 RepID=A0AAE1LFK6_9NEOP|nr:Protein-L-isoaspartate O-methyltransferase 2 [Frankliniella fusca]